MCFRLSFICLFMLSLPTMKGQNCEWDSVKSDFLLGKINYSQDNRFTKLSPDLCNKENAYLLIEVTDSLIKMFSAAKKEGIHFMVISASRNFDQQKRIWEKKWLARKSTYPQGLDRAKNILSYSSMPGTSRHHWGTDFDLNALDPQYFNQGKGKKEYEWLIENANRFGFYQPYDHSVNRTGYNEEKWHWSFFPIAQKLTEQYSEKIQFSDITPFMGCEYAEPLNVIKIYVNGIQSPPIHD